MSEMALALIRRAKKKGWKRLNLGNTGIIGAVPEEVGDLEELEELILSEEWWEWTWTRWLQRKTENTGPANKITHLPANPPRHLKKLVFSRTRVADLAPVANLTQLQTLYCSETNVADLTPVKKLSQLKSLYCSYSQVTDLAPVANLTQLQALDCFNTQVADLAPLANLTKLQSLDCSYTQVADLAPVANLTQLQTLDCSYSQVADLAPVANLTQLKTLDCSETQVADLAPVANLTQLQELRFWGTQVTDLAPVANLTQLQELGCSGTQVADLAPVANLTHLQTLGCSRTQVADLGPVAKLTQLQTLNCNNTQVADLAPVANLSKLQELYCSETQVADLAPVANLTQLQSLNCSYTQVADLAPVANLTQLQELNCSGTQVADLAPVANLTQLQTLNCSSTQVADLAPVANLTQLQELNCYNTKVTYLAPVANLTQLLYLDCSSTLVADLAPVANLKQLQSLNCSYTQVADLAPVKHLIKNNVLKEIGVHGCPLTNPPIEIANKGYAAILAYWAEQERKQTIPANEIKLFLLGNTTAGKSTLRDGLCTGEWVEQKSTHGAALNKTWDITDKGIKINLWDFGGQEYYHSTHSLYLGANSLYAVVVDPARNQPGEWPILIPYFGEKEPKEELLEHFPHAYWLEMVAKYKPQGTVFLIWNKLDKKEVPPFRATDNDLQLVKPAGLEEYKISLQAALQDKYPAWLPKWDTIYHDLAQAAQKALQGQEWITYWPVIKADLEQVSRTRIEMPLSELRSRSAWWANHAPDEPYEATPPPAEMDDAVFGNILTHLRDMTGSILYWPNGPLKHRVFINPHKINELIYAVLTRQVKDQGGRFTRGHAAEQIPKGLDTVYGAGNWTEDPEKLADTLLLIMRQFGIVFEVAENSGEYVAPQYLGKEEPEALPQVLRHANLAFAFQLQFHSYIPRHIVPRFIVANGINALQEIFWKYGILFKSGDVSCLLKVNYPQNTITCKIQNPDSNGSTIKTILDELRGLIGQDDAFAISLDGHHFIRFEKLCELQKHQAPKIVWGDGSEMPMHSFDFYFNPSKTNNQMHYYISHHPTDKSYAYELKKQFAGDIRRKTAIVWSKEDVIPGEIIQDRVKDEIGKADVIFVLSSSDYWSLKGDLAKEYDLILERAKMGVQIVPIIVRAYDDWIEEELGKYAPAFEGKAIGSQPLPDEAWNEVKKWVKESFKVFQEEKLKTSHPAGKTDQERIIEISKSLIRIEGKVDGIHGKLDQQFSHLMHKLQTISDLGNDAYHNLMMLGEKTYWSVEALQGEFEDQNAQLEAALQSVLERITERSPETAQKLKAELAPAAEMTKGRKFLQSIKLKLPVIAIATALVATGGAAGVGLGLATALAGAIEWETNLDAAIQKVIEVVKSLDKPLPENWQPTN